VPDQAILGIPIAVPVTRRVNEPKSLEPRRGELVAMKWGRLGGLAATSALVVLWGCSGVTSYEGQEFAIVKGNVKLKGKPVDGGFLNYTAQVGALKVLGPDVPIQGNGTYEGRARVGKNYVTLQPRTMRGKVSKVDQELTVDVKSGTNSQDLEFN